MSKTPSGAVRPASASAPDRGGRPPVPARTPLTVRIAAAVAGLLALFGLGTLAAILILALQNQSAAPWLVASTYFALPLAFLLMGGLVIDGIRRRRRG